MNKQIEKRISFIVIGAMKSGTSYLANNLEQHPDISFCREKEPHYFSKEKINASTLEKYHQLFDFSKLQQGEASTTYTFYPEYNKDVAKDIYTYNPNIKLIYIVRAPLDRISSDYMHLYSRKYTHLEFNEAIRKVPGIIDRTKYNSHIQRYLQYFNRDQLLVLKYEELNSEPEFTFNQITSFLGITPFDAVDTQRVNASLNTKKTSHQFNKIPMPLRKITSLLFPTFIKETIRNTFFMGRQLHARPILTKESKEHIENALAGEMEALYQFENGIDYRF